jgi:hypothetical protein
VYGVDDLGVVDSAQVGGRYAEIGVSELSLDHDERNAFAGHLDGVSVPQLMRREPATNAGFLGSPVQLGADAGWCAGSSARGTTQDAEQGSDW